MSRKVHGHRGRLARCCRPSRHPVGTRHRRRLIVSSRVAPDPCPRGGLMARYGDEHRRTLRGPLSGRIVSGANAGLDHRTRRTCRRGFRSGLFSTSARRLGTRVFRVKTSRGDPTHWARCRIRQMSDCLFRWENCPRAKPCTVTGTVTVRSERRARARVHAFVGQRVLRVSAQRCREPKPHPSDRYTRVGGRTYSSRALPDTTAPLPNHHTSIGRTAVVKSLDRKLDCKTADVESASNGSGRRRREETETERETWCRTN